MNPLISVVIPCYNDGAYLSETITKLHLQLLKDFEIIIVNDGSSDINTLSVLKQLEGQENITVLHKQNGRMSSARNYGVKYAKGTYIAALDADDYFDASFFEKAVAILKQEPNTAVVTSYIKYFGTKTGNSKPRGGNAFNFLFSNQCPACAMVRKNIWDLVGGYDEDMKLGYEDWEFYIRITKLGYEVHLIPEYLLFYRQTQKSTLANDTHPNRADIIKYILEKHKDWYIQCLNNLIGDNQVIYTESRIAYATIWKLLKSRLTGKYK